MEKFKVDALVDIAFITSICIAVSIFMGLYVLGLVSISRSAHFTDEFISQQDELPLNYFGLNRRGGIIWSREAHLSFNQWFLEQEIESRVNINLIGNRARRHFNFGLLNQLE